ncbi:MAG: hypothetical protein ABI538_01730 [Pseudoxanthomonas sp.]
MFQICQNESCGFRFIPVVFVSEVLVPDMLIPRVPLSRWAMTTGMVQAMHPETMLHCETFCTLRVFMRDGPQLRRFDGNPWKQGIILYVVEIHTVDRTAQPVRWSLASHTYSSPACHSGRRRGGCGME